MINAGLTRVRSIPFTVDNNTITIFTTEKPCIVYVLTTIGNRNSTRVFYSRSGTNGGYSPSGITISGIIYDAVGTNETSSSLDHQNGVILPAGVAVRATENQSGGFFNGTLYVLELE